jgi:hypothetical protein
MRSVVIVHDRTDRRRPWVAIDRESGTPVLRFQDRDQLEGVCSRLGWNVVVQDDSERRANCQTFSTG